MKIPFPNFTKRRNKALVLGCGPAGMFAAHALISSGYDIQIWSKNRKSRMYGAQYLHLPIPGLAERSTEIRYLLFGTPEGYARKIYGDGLDPFSTSVAKYASERAFTVWDIRAAYDDAWEQYSPLVSEWEANQYFEPDNKFDAIVSSIPAKELCRGGHQFHSQRVWASGDAPEQGWTVPMNFVPGAVHCSGEKSVGWYRKSEIFGYCTVEWPTKPPFDWAVEVEKPLSTNCDCNLRVNHSDILRVGRYGTWKKGTLAHHAYFDTRNMVNGRSR